jgi:hypothetical protein
MKILSGYLEKAETYERIADEVPDDEVKLYLLDKASAYRQKAVKRANGLSLKPSE